MVQPKEGQLGPITVLDEDTGGIVTASDANMQDVGGVTHNALGSTPGNNSFWTENTVPSLPKFTNSNGTTITLGSGTGDVSGPASGTDNVIAVFDGVTGKIIKESGFKMPVSDGTPNQVLSTNGSGDLTFITAGTPIGPDRSIQFNNSGAFQGDAELLYSDDGTDNYIELKNINSAGSTGLIFYDNSATQSMLFTFDDNASIGLIATLASTDLEVSGSGNLNLSANSNIVIDAGAPLTWPSSDGANGEVLTTDGAGNLSWSSGVQPPNVLTVVASTPTTIIDSALAERRIIPVDTSASGTNGPATINLPAAPFEGEIITIKDWGNSSALNQITVGFNGNNINNVPADDTLSDDGGAISYIWDSTLNSWISF